MARARDEMDFAELKRIDRLAWLVTVLAMATGIGLVVGASWLAFCLL